VIGRQTCTGLTLSGCNTVLTQHVWRQAVTTAVAFQFGLGSALFAVALCFSLVVMYDAAGVRRHAGATPT